MIKYIREILIILLILWVAGKYIFETPETITETTTVVEHDTVEVEIESDPIIKWKEKEVKDTTGLAELNSVIDSLQAEMNKLADSLGTLGTYTAVVDTSLQDSSGSKVADISVKVESRIPLDPKLRFLIRATAFNTIITNTTTITKGKTFWQRFGISAQTGIGMGVLSKQWDIYVGIGFHFEIM